MSTWPSAADNRCGVTETANKVTIPTIAQIKARRPWWGGLMQYDKVLSGYDGEVDTQVGSSDYVRTRYELRLMGHSCEGLQL